MIAYEQTKTAESSFFDLRRGIEENGHNKVDKLVNKITEASSEHKPVVIQWL